MAGDRQPIYCLDTSALIHAWVRAYPPDVMPSLWDRLSELIEAGVVVSPLDVFVELEKREGDTLHNWCKARRVMFIEIDGFQPDISHIMGNYPKLVDTAKGKSGADPVVIALARSHNPRLVVVTEERGGSIDKPKIPFVCEREGIKYINVLQLIRDQGWVFSS